MFTDIVGYTAFMGEDVEKGLNMLRKNRQIHKETIEKYQGKYLKEIGDGTLASFNSANDAVHCALEIQKLAGIQLDAKLRIGLHLGDVTFENDDVFGDGVNIASRLQSIADPGGIYISESIYEAIRARSDIHCGLLGNVKLKNVDHLLRIYFLQEKGLPIPSIKKIRQLTDERLGSKMKSGWLYAFILLIVISLAIIKFWIPGSGLKNIRSVAVLPIEDLSGNMTEDWLSAGIHHGLIDELMKIQSLRVVSRTSAMKYQSTDKSIPEIAEELNVDGILEVTCFRGNDALNIHVRLIRARPKEQQLWSNAFEREMRDVLTTYGDVAKLVAEKINIELSTKEKQRLGPKHPVDPDAYEAYLKGMMYWSKLGKKDLDEAMQFFQQAIEIDPEFALAHAGIALIWGGRMQGGYVPFSEAGSKVKAAMQKALELDSTLTQMHYLKAVTGVWFFWDWEAGKKEFYITLDQNPNHADANAYYAHLLGILGSPDQAIPYGKKAVELEKLNARMWALYGMTLRHAHKPDQAIEALEEARIQFPREIMIHSTLRSAYHDKAMYQQAIEAGIQYYTIKNDSVNKQVLETAYRTGGYHHALLQNADAMEIRSDTTYVTPWQIATIYTRAGIKDQALNWLEKAYEARDPNMPYISVDPIFDYLKDEIRFQTLLRKMRLN